MATDPSSERFDIERPEALRRYLEGRAALAPGEGARFEVLRGGVSNRTVLVRRDGGEDWVIKQALTKLRVATPWFSSPERIHREADGMRFLARLAPAGSVPALVFEDRDAHVLAMVAVPEPHENWKAALLDGRLDDDHVAQFARLLGTVHRRAQRPDEIGAVRAAFGDRTFFENLRLEPYYLYAAERVPEAAGFLERLVDDTRARAVTLVHGDYSPKNVLIHDGRLVLLDHEVIHVGDPAFDVGFATTHLLGKAHHLGARRGAFATAARRLWEGYRAEVAEAPFFDGLEAASVRHTLGCLLARVDGRSPLEYLTTEERRRQRRVVLELMTAPPDRIAALVDAFVEGVQRD